MVNAARVGLVTFGAGLPNWRAAARRLGRQARESGLFTQVAVITDRSLPSQFPDFWNSHRSMLQSSIRGYGYWMWKPYLIGRLMREWSNDIDFLIYLDSGCEINMTRESVQRWEGYLDLAAGNEGRFAMSLPGHAEQDWSKSDTMEFLGLTREQRASDQIQATVSLFANSPLNLEFTDQWLSSCLQNNYHFVDDSPSVTPNAPTFIEHRHDQSIFSGLFKQCGGATIPDETFWAPNWSPDGLDYPIWTPRNRTRIATLDQRLSSRAIRFSERAYSKMYREASRFTHR